MRIAHALLGLCLISSPAGQEDSAPTTPGLSKPLLVLEMDGPNRLRQAFLPTDFGSMLASRLWEERRLAYPINGHRKGTYWLSYFRVSGDQIAGLNRQCQITDEILRHLVLKVDPRIVDTLVSHAAEGPAKTSRTPKTEKPSDKEEKVAVVATGEKKPETEDS